MIISEPDASWFLKPTSKTIVTKLLVGSQRLAFSYTREMWRYCGNFGWRCQCFCCSSHRFVKSMELDLLSVILFVSAVTWGYHILSKSRPYYRKRRRSVRIQVRCSKQNWRIPVPIKGFCFFHRSYNNHNFNLIIMTFSAVLWNNLRAKRCLSIFSKFWSVT